MINTIQIFITNNQLIILLSFLLLLIIICLFFVITYCFSQLSAYLNQLSEATISQLKSPIGRLQRYSLINTLKIMKKFITVSILLIIITIVSICSVIVLNSQDYFKQYFKIQQQKLTLRSVECVDSLQNRLSDKEIIIDSLIIDNAQLTYNIKLLKEDRTEKYKLIKNLQMILENREK